jgi:hypothetical protein
MLSSAVECIPMVNTVHLLLLFAYSAFCHHCDFDQTDFSLGYSLHIAVVA